MYASHLWVNRFKTTREGEHPHTWTWNTCKTRWTNARIGTVAGRTGVIRTVNKHSCELSSPYQDHLRSLVRASLNVPRCSMMWSKKGSSPHNKASTQFDFCLWPSFFMSHEYLPFSLLYWLKRSNRRQMFLVLQFGNELFPPVYLSSETFTIAQKVS